MKTTSAPNSGNEGGSDEENDTGERDESSDVILAYIDNEEIERPATTRSGRAITRRSEIAKKLPCKKIYWLRWGGGG